ncbi:MAG: F0F1 ATP synthase subunit A [Candidatus Absconditabacterales bacterium]
MKKVINKIMGFLVLCAAVIVPCATFASDDFSGKTDKYYELTAPNLNTLNSYIIPKGEPADLSSYDTYTVDISNVKFHIVSTYPGLLLLLILISILGYYVRRKPDSRLTILFLSLYHGLWDFFEEVLGSTAPLWITKFVTHLFLVIFLSNLIGIFNDIIRFFAPQWLRYVTSPTAEFEFNLGLALIAVFVTLFIQRKELGLGGILHEYFPITGKGLIDGKGIGAKIGDIVLSLFIGILDVIGVVSKIVSLSMRLFGNMSSGSILLNVSIIGFTVIGTKLLGFALPIGLPVITYLQSLLVAFVQAFVFSLIVAIGIKAVLND